MSLPTKKQGTTTFWEDSLNKCRCIALISLKGSIYLSFFGLFSTLNSLVLYGIGRALVLPEIYYLPPWFDPSWRRPFFFLKWRLLPPCWLLALTLCTMEFGWFNRRTWSWLTVRLVKWNRDLFVLRWWEGRKKREVCLLFPGEFLGGQEKPEAKVKTTIGVDEFCFYPFFEVNSCHHHHLVMSLRTHVVPPGWWKVKFVPVGCPIKWGFKVTISSVVPRGWSDDRAKTGHDSPVAMIFVWFSCLTSAKKKNSIICAKRI